MNVDLKQPMHHGRSRSLWIGFWVFLFTITHIPITHGGSFSIQHGDKVVHFAIYYVLTWLGGRRVVAMYGSRSVGRLAFWVAAYFAYAALDEWLQQWVGRTMSLGDWVADAAGVLAATGWLLWTRSCSRLSEPPTEPHS